MFDGKLNANEWSKKQLVHDFSWIMVDFAR
jgi:hypothetical protein